MSVGRRDMLIAVLASVAMAVNFVWFDLPGHGGAFLERDLLLRAVFADGHTCFLIGMLAVSLLIMGVPRWFERHAVGISLASAAVGTLALAVQYALPVAAAWSVGAAVVTGVANIQLLAVDVLLLTRVADRFVAGGAVACVFVLRGVFMYLINAFLPGEAQLGCALVLPMLCALLTCGALHLAVREPDAARPLGPVFEKPLSTAMIGLLVLSSVAFAAACAVGNTGFWGTPFALDGMGPGALIGGSALFFVVTYVTLVKTEASLLLRFMPGLLVLFVAYSFLYLGTGSQLGLSPEALLVVGHFAEYYGEAFSWFVMLLAVRTLAMPPYRVVGISFSVNAAMTVLFQYLIIFDSNADLCIVQMSFFAMFAVLVWALYHFYGIGSRFRDARFVDAADSGDAAPSGETVSREPAIAAIPAASGAADLQAMAAAHGLSERETDVFLLLAYGHSRRYICDRLFIADGTASTHIRRIYEKMGVSSKQDLLSLVGSWASGEGAPGRANGSFSDGLSAD